MNEQIPEIDRMIMESHYLDSLELEDRCSGLAESERKHYTDTIQSLNDTIRSLNATIMQLTADTERLSESIERERAKSDYQMKVLMKKLTDQTEELKALRSELKKYKDRNDRSNRDLYGKRSQKSKTKQDAGLSREEESDKFDGTAASLNQVTAPFIGETSAAAGASELEVSAEEAGKNTQESSPIKGRGPRGPYRNMHADYVEVIKCRTDIIPEGMRYVGIKTVSEYEKISATKETRYEVMIVEDEYGNRHDVFIPQNPDEKRRPCTETMPGTHVKPSLLAYFATARHQMSIPVYREMIQVMNEKMQMCAQTVGNWLHIGAEFLRLLLPSLKEHLLRDLDVLHIDETWTRIRIKTDGSVHGRYMKKYIWVVVNKLTKVVYFLYDNDEQDSRGRRPIQNFLGGFLGGIQTDAYAAYRFFSELDARNTRAVCWAHARAKLVDSATISKDEDAQELINDIGYLYGVELENRLQKRSTEEIMVRRNRKDVTDTMKRIRSKIRWLLLHRKRTLSDMMLRALNYMENNWDELQTYRTDGKYDIDNLEAERSIRPWTVSRKNIVSFGSEKGVKDAAVYSTFIETCKKNGICPQDYFTRVFAELRDGNRDYESLLPFNIALN